MKGNRKFVGRKADEEAVSAVIGVILMVAITVAIAATVYVYVSGMIGGTATKTSTLSMNTFSQNDATNTRVWLVSGIEGEAILNTSYDWALLDINGIIHATATCQLNEVVGPGYINSGDTFTVISGPGIGDDGYFVFMLTDTSTGATIFKSPSVKY